MGRFEFLCSVRRKRKRKKKEKKKKKKKGEKKEKEEQEIDYAEAIRALSTYIHTLRPYTRPPPSPPVPRAVLATYSTSLSSFATSQMLC